MPYNATLSLGYDQQYDTPNVRLLTGNSPLIGLKSGWKSMGVDTNPTSLDLLGRKLS